MVRLVDADFINGCLLKFKALFLTRWGEKVTANVPAMVDGVTRGISNHIVEYRRRTCPDCGHEWLEDCDATDYPNYCPGCGKELKEV